MKIDAITDIARILTDEAAAQDAFAKLRWPNGVECPLCDGGKRVYEVSYKFTAKDGTETVRKQWKCGACRRKFSVTSRSIFEGSYPGRQMDLRHFFNVFLKKRCECEPT
jgi:transposase-like protein